MSSRIPFLLEGGLVTKSCLTVGPHGLQPARLLCPLDSPGKNTGVVCHFLLQGISLTPGLLHCGQILYQLSYEEKYVLKNNIHRHEQIHMEYCRHHHSGQHYLFFGVIIFADVFSNCYAAIYLSYDIFSSKPIKKWKV